MLSGRPQSLVILDLYLNKTQSVREITRLSCHDSDIVYEKFRFQNVDTETKRRRFQIPLTC